MLKLTLFAAAAANFAFGSLIFGTMFLAAGCVVALAESFGRSDEDA
jgi:hypothetical protein